ncbi:MAG: porin family protein, partial [Rhodomicrobium sp.]|nr:porin family protein [Rhodomicrobium sp.]
MKLLSGILGLTLTSVVALASANAADMYGAPAGGGYKDGPAYVGVNWSGLYGGVNVGYGEHVDYDDISGGFAGGQIGFNFQRGNLVYGVETDFQFSGIGASYNGWLGSASIDLNYFGTVRGRLGYAFDRALVYATGGFAYGELEAAAAIPLLGWSWHGSEVETGYVLGGGVEY